jgi:hypothetical protein
MSLTKRVVKGEKLTIQEMDDNLTYLEELAQNGSITGTQYIFVQANGTDIENAQELQDAYDTAKGMSASITNRITVIAAPGNYNFDTSAFVMDEEYIDLVSLDGNRSIIFNGSVTISITANDVFVKGVNVLTKNFTIRDNLNLLKVENCGGGNLSFGGGLEASGTFTDCVGGDESFGSNGTSSGTFIDCQGGDGSFGGEGGVASGTFIDCQGGDGSFGGGGTVDGTFTNCLGGIGSFGGDGEASGIFTNCQGGDGSFGGGDKGVLKGKLYYCILTENSFRLPTESGMIRACIDGRGNFISSLDPEPES